MDSIYETLSTAITHYQRGELSQVARLCQEVLDKQPQNADALHLLGVSGMQAGQYAEAIQLLQLAASLSPKNSTCLVNLGFALLSAGRNEEAQSVLKRATALAPDFGEAHYNLGVVLYNLGRLDEAAASYRRSIECRSQEVLACNNLANVYLSLGTVSEALAWLDKGLEIDPQFAGAHFNRAMALLKLGRLDEGWAEYEWRSHAPEFQGRRFSQPRWDGAPLENATLLVFAEQGLGDTIQLLRYLPLVRDRCPRTILEVQPRLLPLLEASGLRNVVAQKTQLPPFDVQIPMGSLPRVFGTTLATIPECQRIIQPPSKLVEYWRTELSSYSGFKVGIAWQGSLDHLDDRYRSIPLAMFAPLARVDDVKLFSLQKGPGTEQLALRQNEFPVMDLADRLDVESGPFMDTAAIIGCMDLIVTCDTATAHLAGALGASVWVALCMGADWRWLTDRSDSPWYPTMRLYRQRAFKDWPHVFADMARALEELVGR